MQEPNVSQYKLKIAVVVDHSMVARSRRVQIIYVYLALCLTLLHSHSTELCTDVNAAGSLTETKLQLCLHAIYYREWGNLRSHNNDHQFAPVSCLGLSITKHILCNFIQNIGVILIYQNKKSINSHTEPYHNHDAVEKITIIPQAGLLLNYVSVQHSQAMQILSRK